ncbi:hypothetical protein [Ferviditalea candida]|uniref:Uncharacterized protein n=1 Tax=Ferviditalea candida TaxID=3108399 RepID=A0ABU5ZKR6_9BACL|nr:hypothetical protein [Paenibacillaceae bacterium T2]
MAKYNITDDPSAIVRPENPISEMVVEIRIVGNLIEVHNPDRHDDLYDLAKGILKLSWERGRWVRKIHPTNGTVEDRAAEIGHRLLDKGFIIHIENESIREKAISGQYEQECIKWIMMRTKGEYEGWFTIEWDRGVDDFYSAARRITGSKWNKPYVVVPARHFDEVMDFAGKYGFQLSKGAQELIEKAHAERAAELIVHVPKPTKQSRTIIADKPPVLDIPQGDEIDENFRDDD